MLALDQVQDWQWLGIEKARHLIQSTSVGFTEEEMASNESIEIKHTYCFDADEFERRLVLTDDDTVRVTAAPAEEVKKKLTPCSRFLRFMNAYILPIGLLVFVIFGALVPAPGVAIRHEGTKYACVVGIFFYSGLFLKTNEMKEAVKAYKAYIWGFISSLFVTSVIGTKLTDLLKFDETTTFHNSTREGGPDKALFGSSEFKTGFQLFFVVPCTISSGVLMVNQLGGNNALAVLLTVLCNVVGIFTVPPMMRWLLDSPTAVKLDIVRMLVTLLLTLLLPLLVGKALQYIKVFYTFCLRIKPVLRIISTFLLICLAFMKISQASASGSLAKVSAVNLVLLICWNWTVHSVFLILNGLVSLLLRLKVEEAKCVVILCSQKSLAIGMSILGFLPYQFGDQGLIAIPLVLSHLSMILYDACVISIWLKCRPMSEEEKESPPSKKEAQSQTATHKADIHT